MLLPEVGARGVYRKRSQRITYDRKGPEAASMMRGVISAHVDLNERADRHGGFRRRNVEHGHLIGPSP